MKNNVLVVVVLVALAGGVMWYMNKPASAPAAEQTVPESNSVMTASGTAGAVGADDVKEIVVDGSEFKFAPATITLKKGEKVRLVLKNVGKMPHDFVVDELNVKTKIIKGGEEDVVEFTPDTAGTFEFYCSVGSHRAMGMKGTLTVTE